jgi:hypothetical protein
MTASAQLFQDIWMANHTHIGETTIGTQHRASCHCGAVVLELSLPHGIENPRRCNCSMCSRRGAIAASIPLANLRIVQGEQFLTRYQFHTRTAEHYFCRICGVYTHHKRRSDPTVYAYNIACLDGVNPLDIGEVPTSDGINHLADRKTA